MTTPDVQQMQGPITVLNFSHPLTAHQCNTICNETGQPIQHIESIPFHLDNAAGFRPQIARILDNLYLTADAWQTTPIIIIPPGYAPAALTLIADLHGRMGYFPTIARVRPIPASLPPQFEVAELIDLSSTREAARASRVVTEAGHQQTQ